MLLSVILGIVTLKLVLLAAIEPRRSRLSSFELSRLKSAGNTDVSRDITREQFATDIISLKRVVIALLLVVITVLAVQLWGVMIGIVVSLAVALLYGNVARLPLVTGLAKRWYAWAEPSLLHIVAKYQPVMKLIRSTVA